VVLFPRDCLNRFTSIALINTARNRETCGLLLGNDKGGRYVVTTLLIPKQHATSDSFAIDEEDLVIRFREERSLITFGWVCLHIYRWIRCNTDRVVIVRYTRIRSSHVGVYCNWNGRTSLNLTGLTGFMSSLDLHTHSGFQRMLPEAFAVVCAPNSTPKYAFPVGRSYQLLIAHSAFRTASESSS
jgi:STAM-binding protein